MKWQLTLGGVVRQGRPLSGEAVRVAHRELVEVGQDREGQAAVLSGLLRKSFPLSWRFLWDGDPVRLVIRSPARDLLVADFLKVPPEKVVPKVMDEWDALEAAQTVAPQDWGGPTVTLDAVCRLTEQAMGAGWYWNPDRWPTWDGYAPYDVVWRAWATMQQARAFERINMIRAIGISKAGDRATALYDSEVREALGG